MVKTQRYVQHHQTSLELKTTNDTQCEKGSNLPASSKPPLDPAMPPQSSDRSISTVDGQSAFILSPEDSFHFQLPHDLVMDWPFDFGQGPVFNFLGFD